MNCNRCGSDLEGDMIRHLEEGGPHQCSRCTLELPEPPAAWLLANGYNLPEAE